MTGEPQPLTLAEEFLCDLDDEEDDDEGAGDLGQPREGSTRLADDSASMDEKSTTTTTTATTTTTTTSSTVKTEEGEGESGAAEDAAEEMLAQRDAKSIAKILHSEKLTALMKQVEHYSMIGRAPTSGPIVGSIEDDKEYQLMQQANNMAVEISNEMEALHKYVRDLYSARFPELESLIPLPIDYARTIIRIGNEMDITRVDLTDILPPPLIMGVAVSGSSTNTQSKVLDPETLQRVLDGCQMIIRLDAIKQRILDYVESRMLFIAPNVTAIVGSTIAAKIMGAAGGLNALARLPASTIQILGQKRSNLTGFAASHFRLHTGYIYDCDIIKKTPIDLRMRACRLIAGRLTLAVRVDNTNDAAAVTGEIGRKLHDFIVKRIEVWQEPPPTKQVKPLAAPDDKPKKRRGGKRVRKLKERFAVTEVRKQANRIPFGGVEETFRESGKGFGMLGLSGSGKLRISATDKGIIKKNRKDRTSGGSASTAGGIRSVVSGFRSSASGFSSSLSFTPVQGIELVNPSLARGPMPPPSTIPSSKDYFADTASFVAPKKNT
ncbi:U4/U6 small nuclear ribonucleoprotein Prp31 [Pelomyxa schiedti]|nr:U4/U6 small nuclear ribonucleoprotein Prp31 [Pelomyxa schiedti]